MVINMEHYPNSEEEKKYLQHLIKKHNGQFIADIAKRNNREKKYTNNDYKSITKEIDKMLMERQIDKLLNKKQRKNRKEKEELETNKSIDLTCKIAISKNTEEEIIELPAKPEKDIVELYRETDIREHRKKHKINWIKELNLS